MNKALRWFLTNIAGPIILWYIQNDRKYSYKGIHLIIKKGVFHPGFFFSTKFLISTFEKESVSQKKILELGAGSGLISFYLERKGAYVVSTDFNPIAIEGLELNKMRLKSTIQIIYSDLFKDIPSQIFDVIIINPPYFPKEPKNHEELAWFCGSDFQYFYQLFKQIGIYMNSETKVFMSLSENCQIDRIIEIAQECNFNFSLFEKKRILGELNYIYQIFKN